MCHVSRESHTIAINHKPVTLNQANLCVAVVELAKWPCFINSLSLMVALKTDVAVCDDM